MSIAPYHVHVLPLQTNDAEVKATAEAIYEALVKDGFEVLLDDREERAGVKFKDADLIGLPVRVQIGSRALKEGKVELKVRTGGELEKISANPEDVVARIRAILRA